MASRTGLMPAKAKGDNTAKMTTISARRTIQFSKAVPPLKAASVTNRRRTDIMKPLSTVKHQPLTKKAVVPVALPKKGEAPVSLKANVMTKTVPLAGNKYISKPVKNTSNMRKSHAEVVSVERVLTKFTTPGKRSLATDLKTPKSILKKGPWIPSTGKASAQKVENSVSHHVKFNNKATNQAVMRAKLNAWLESKGKAPKVTDYRHHKCFDVDMSAKRNRDVLGERRINQNSLLQPVKVPNKESVKKELFTDRSRSPLMSDKENLVQCEDPCSIYVIDASNNAADHDAEEMDHPDAETNKENPNTAKADMPLCENVITNFTDEDVFNKIQAELDECLSLYKAGYPLESILQWLTEMETSIPRVLTFAAYYVCKAKLVAMFPQMVLDIFCEAVRNNAQPSEFLAMEMKCIFSQILNHGNDSNKTGKDIEQTSKLDVPDTKSGPNMNTVSGHRSNCSTPKQASKGAPALSNMGSTIKYSISSTKRHWVPSPTNSTIAVVTPVRRSTRLSGKPPAVTPALRREVNSVSDLSTAECHSMLFRTNPALTDY